MNQREAERKSLYDVEAALQAGRDIIGVPFQHQGRDINRGLDCSGVMLHMMQTGGWKARAPEITYATNYSRHGSWRNISAGLKAEGYPISLEQCLPMDLVLIHWEERKIPQHFAIVSRVGESLEDIYILHTHHSLTGVRENRLYGELRSRIHSVHRFHGWVLEDPLAESFNPDSAPISALSALNTENESWQ